MKLKNIALPTLFLFIAMFSGAYTIQAQHTDHAEHSETESESVHSSHNVLSPAGVMGDHIHEKGSWMFSYMYMNMKMNGLYDRRSELNSIHLMDQYEMMPDDMYMQMHMLGTMYAVSDKFTLMAMVPLLQKDMGHSDIGHHRSTMNSSGLGDIKLSVITPLYRKNNHSFILNGGVTLPTGSIDISSGHHMGMGNRMGYGMQLGSGTTDLHALVSYSGQTDNLGFGSQLGGVVRLVNNSEQYRHGNSVEHSAWIGRNIVTPLSATVRLHTSWQDHIHGSDENINPMMIPTADPLCYGGLRSRIMGGLNLKLAHFLPVNGTLGIEAGLPLYQNLNGPQMGESRTILSTVRISI